jgi:hypothetical protein
LWIGLALVAASVVAGARLLAGADDTARVWALARQEGAGAHLTPADLVVRRVRFAQSADLALYYSADSPLPRDAVLARSVGAGELLARSAVGPAAGAEVVRVSVEVDPGRVDPSVHAGSVVDVYLDDQGDRSGDPAGGVTEGKVLADVTVLAAPPYDATFAVSGMRQVVLAVPAGEVDRFERERAALQDPVINLDVR